MSRFRPNPPPHREGLRPSCVVVPSGARVLALEFFVARFAAVARSDWQQRLDAGDIVDSEGVVIRADTMLQGDQRIYYFRALEAEPRVPFQEHIIWQDEHIVVADKPHFLPVIPSGKYVRETLLVRLGHTLNTDTLAPAHRIDRDTAGLVLFTRNPATRNRYHQLFREHRVQKPTTPRRAGTRNSPGPSPATPASAKAATSCSRPKCRARPTPSRTSAHSSNTAATHCMNSAR